MEANQEEPTSRSSDLNELILQTCFHQTYLRISSDLSKTKTTSADIITKLLQVVSTVVPHSPFIPTPLVAGFLACSSLEGVRSGAEIAAASLVPGDAVRLPDLPSDLSSSLPRGRVLTGALATDWESVDYTCSLAAIIRGMTQHLSVGEERELS